MRMFLSVFLLLLFLSPACADVLSLDDALRATYSACVGIDDNLAELKKMAGINTAVTGVGTGLNVGATVVGVVKTGKDAEAVKLEKLVKELHEMEDGISSALLMILILLLGFSSFGSSLASFFSSAFGASAFASAFSAFSSARSAMFSA